MCLLGMPWARGLALFLSWGILSLASQAPLQAQGLPRAESLTLPGLDEPVEILKDRWGIAHIYAGTEHDLFFA